MNPYSLRLDAGGIIDRSCPLSFQFDGKQMTGFKGDTVASALMANGINLVARSFKYHRPRGFFGAGSEEPNAIVTIGTGAHSEPNLVATQIPLIDGMSITSQNRWPNLNWDIGALNGFFKPLLPSGFYYKTFMWPPWAWKHYEHMIRNAAGFGISPDKSDPDIYLKRYCHCDVLVVGAGLWGLQAAKEAAATGARVIICDEAINFGGAMLDDPNEASKGIALSAKLSEIPDVTILPMTTVFGWFDHNYLLAATSHYSNHETGKLRQTLYKIRAAKVVLATGALERSLLFENNDLPGVMLCSAVKRYINRYAVRPGQVAIVYTNNDTGYELLDVLNRAGIQTKAIVDRRVRPPSDVQICAERNNIEVLLNSHISAVYGGKRVREVKINNNRRKITCDLVCVSGGWTPTTHLLSQRGGRLRFSSKFKTLLAGENFGDDYEVIGAAAGELSFQGEIETDWSEAVKLNRSTKIFVDLQNDVLAADLALAVREGYGDVELAKRYTTTGMGTDQGKTSNVHAVGVLAELTQRSEEEIGHTTFRAPYTPVTFGTLVGRNVGKNLTPIRRTPFHLNHVKADVVFEPSSNWLYPKYYRRNGEDMDAAIVREVINTRESVGMVDMSSLGKLEVCGSDVCKFLELAYINTFSKLPVGRCRYGVLLRHDGMVLDDGTITRIADDRYLITMTTAQAWHTQLHLERLLQVDYPELDVVMLPVTEHWASLAIAGPRARDVLQKLNPNFDLSNDSFPFTHFREGKLASLSVRVFRVSFSGELCFEINVEANHAGVLWEAVREAGEEFGITPYGLEALDIMRIEKGHLNVGTEIDGKTTPYDLGLSRMVKEKDFFIGRPLLNRKELQREDRLQLVGLKSSDGISMIPRGAIIFEAPQIGPATNAIGHVTATVNSPTLNIPIALALVESGRSRNDNHPLFADSSVDGKSVKVKICSPIFVDPKGERLRA